MKHVHAGIIIGSLLISAASPGVAFACMSAKAVCKAINACVLDGGANATYIRNGAADTNQATGGHSVWIGLNNCTSGSIPGGSGCTDPDYWTIAHAEVANLDLGFCDRYAN
jgi:hypothetical protein